MLSCSAIATECSREMTNNYLNEIIQADRIILQTGKKNRQADFEAACITIKKQKNELNQVN